MQARKLVSPVLWICRLVKDSRSSWINWVLTILAIIIGTLAYRLALSTYNNQNRPLLQFGEWRVEGIGNDLFFAIYVANNGNEGATDIRMQFVGIDLKTARAIKLKPETPSLWPRLKPGERDEVRIKMNAAEFPYMLSCISYRSERGKDFPAVDPFFALSGLQAGMRSYSAPLPTRSETDALEKVSSCAKA
jgi:hypothetical protein